MPAPQLNPTTLLLVVLGGGIGSGARWMISAWMQGRFGPGLPWGTLFVNVVGCLVLGVVMKLSMSGAIGDAHLRLFLTTGLLGGFTTYSAFNNETLHLLQNGQTMAGMAYGAATLLCCSLAGLAGAALAGVASG